VKLIASKEIKGIYPDLRIGALIAGNVDNTAYPKGLKEHVEKTFKDFADSSQSLDGFKNIKIWQDVYRSFGVNPKKKKPSAEALLGRVVKSGFAPCVNPVVDAYLCAETLHALPIGGYNLDRVSGDIELRLSKGGEEFFGIGADAAELTSAGEVVYSDSSRVLTRCWNYRDCDHAKIDAGTRSLALFAEAPTIGVSDTELMETLEAIGKVMREYFRAICEIRVLGMNESEIELS
jgi:DNA/RNA-binding domain of Phe-tRNA-synthetase-like protein